MTSDRARNSIEAGGSLEGVKTGDYIVVISEPGGIRRVMATAAGPVWVTALGTRFRRENGQPASGGSRPVAMTVEENDRREETRRALGVLRAWGLQRGTVAVRELTLAQLGQVAALLDTFGPRDDLPEHLREAAFARTGCTQIAGEDPISARTRGSAAECAQDALMLLRKGDTDEAHRLLESALYYTERLQERVQQRRDLKL